MSSGKSSSRLLDSLSDSIETVSELRIDRFDIASLVSKGASLKLFCTMPASTVYSLEFWIWISVLSEENE